MDTGVLYCDDNLAWLRELPSESVDLIYLDPPFFSNRVYEVIWGDEAEIRSFKDRWEGGIEHYTAWMKERLVEMHRVLKRTGSLYLHCDPTASHYLKVALDNIFGMRNFRNEVVWKRFSGKNDSKRYGRGHDVILFYTKTATFTWHTQHGPFEEGYVDANYRYVEPDTGRRYRLSDLTANKPGGDVDYEWHGVLPYRNRHWAFSRENMDKFLDDGRIVFRRTGMPVYKRYLDEMPGVPLQDVWTDLRLHAGSKERLGYPTQKPESLLERLLVASSNEDDVVLDPFCGCGTTVAVAERLGRQWVGIDISPTAIEVMRRRYWQQTREWPRIVNTPDSEEALRQLQPFEFQNWIINAVNGSHSTRKVHDFGIDGYWWFTRDPIQVKQSEHVGRPVVDSLVAALHREKTETGYIIAFSFTRGAHEEVARVKRADGLTIKLITVKEVLISVRRDSVPPNFGPRPDADVVVLPAMRKPSELPTAEELIASDQAATA